MKNKVKRSLKIGVTKKISPDSILSTKWFTLRERVMRWLLGDLRRIVVIVPGSDIHDISIREVADGGEYGECV